MRKILSIGGSIIAPSSGFNIDFLTQFRDLIIKQVEQKSSTFVFIVGGGETARKYQNALEGVNGYSEEELDWMGIDATVLNAQFVKRIFKDYAYEEVVQDPTQKIETDKPIIVASGWKPGCSTDTDAVLMAESYGAQEVINLSNVEYVYDKDPSKHEDADPIQSISWQEFRDDIIPDEWEPGIHAPFDPVASEKAQELGLKVSIVDASELQRVERVFDGEGFEGTVID